MVTGLPCKQDITALITIFSYLLKNPEEINTIFFLMKGDLGIIISVFFWGSQANSSYDCTYNQITALNGQKG